MTIKRFSRKQFKFNIKIETKRRAHRFHGCEVLGMNSHFVLIYSSVEQLSRHPKCRTWRGIRDRCISTKATFEEHPLASTQTCRKITKINFKNSIISREKKSNNFFKFNRLVVITVFFLFFQRAK